MGSVAKSYMRKYLIIYEEVVSHICLCNRTLLNFLIYEENFIFCSISVQYTELHRQKGEGVMGEYKVAAIHR